MSLAAVLAVYIPFYHAFPWGVSSQLRLAMFVPLVLAVAIVYRTTRTRRVSNLPRSVAITFLNIAISMIAIAVGLWLVFEVALRYFS
jgi:hypothetical protein